MDTGVVTIFAALTGGALTLLTGWLVAAATGNREREAFRRDLLRNRVERLRGIFEDGLVVLERHERNVGKSAETHLSDMMRLKARLTLGGSQEVATQFEKTAKALDEWAMEARQGGPKDLGNGVTVLSAGTRDEIHREAAAKLWPIFRHERQKLFEIMQDELRNAESALA